MSVGGSGAECKITRVADGCNDRDATNVGQLNNGVVRIPGRRLPGLILQADTVAGFLTQLQDAQACLRSGRAQRADAELDMLIDTLQQWNALIESRLADAGEAL